MLPLILLLRVILSCLFGRDLKNNNVVMMLLLLIVSAILLAKTAIHRTVMSNVTVEENHVS